MLEHCVVIGEIVREAVGNGQQTFALWREIGPRGIRAPDNRGQMVERRIMEIIGPHDRIKTAAIAVVPESDALNVVRSRARVLRDSADFAGRHVNIFGERIDETADQPWTGDAVDLGMLARDPFVRVGVYNLPGRQLSLIPADKAVN